MKTYTEQELRDAYQKGAIYSLIEIRRNDIRETVMVSEKKKKLVDYINEKGYYFSKSCNRYIDDKTVKIKGGSGIDYIIEKIYFI